MATNLATFYQAPSGQRGAGDGGGLGLTSDWTGGGNKAGSNANGIGINTGNPSPKTQDWAAINQTAPYESRAIGQAADDITVVFGADVNNEVAFVSADANTAADAVLDSTTGAVNKTGAQVDIGDYCWGMIPVA